MADSLYGVLVDRRRRGLGHGLVGQLDLAEDLLDLVEGDRAGAQDDRSLVAAVKDCRGEAIPAGPGVQVDADRRPELGLGIRAVLAGG